MAGTPPHILLEGGESLTEVLERIRVLKMADVVVDVSRHWLLRERADVRRLLRTAAADVGKTLKLTVGTVKAGPARTPVPPTKNRVRQRFQRFREQRRAGARERPVRETSSVRLPLVLAALAGALLTSVVVFVLPRARVVIEPVTEPFVTDLTFVLDTSAVESRGTDRVLAAKHIVSEEDSEGEFPVETIVERGDRAAGTAEIVNDTATPQGIKGGTRLQSTSGVLVRTQRDVVVPPHGRAPVSVRADEGGTAGNLDPQRLMLPALSPEGRRVIHAEVVTPLRGGTDRGVRTVARADLDRVSAELARRAEERLRSALAVEATRQQEGNQRWFERPELTRIAVGAVTPSVPVGSEADTVRVRAPVRAEALVVAEDTLRAFVRELLRAGARERAAGTPRGGGEQDVTDQGDLADVHVVDVQWEARTATLSLHVETKAVPRFDAPLLRAQLAGRTAEGAEEFLRALPGVRAARVTLSPVWVRRVPDNPRNVHLTVAISP